MNLLLPVISGNFRLTCLLITLTFILNGFVVVEPSELVSSLEENEIIEITTISPSSINNRGEDETESSNGETPLLAPTISLAYIESNVVKEVISETPGGIVILPYTKYGLDKGQDVPIKVIRFECNASYPVEWSYVGPGAPFDVISKSFRNIQNFSDPSTYSFSTHLDMVRNDERNTGQYVCRRIRGRFHSNKGQEPTSYFQVYITGPKLFLDTPDRFKVQKLSMNSTHFTIPCAISNPEMSGSVKLYKIQDSKPKRANFPRSYDPTIGFTIKMNKTSPSSISDYSARYFCKEPLTRKMSRGYEIKGPKEFYVDPRPPQEYVKVQPNRKQSFICAAKENVTLTFSGADRQPRVVNYFVVNENITQYPYVASMEINPGNMTGEHIIIKCVTTKGGEVLHTWEYSSYDDVSLQKFFFDAQKRYQDARYVCCSDSYYKLKLEFTFCRTETECGMKKLMFDQSPELKTSYLEEHAHRISRINDTCVAFYPYLKYTLQSGVIRCSLGGVNRETHRDFMYYFNPYRIYQAFTDDKFNTSKVLGSESIMKLSKTPAKNTLKGKKVRFLCYFSELFLSNGIIWKVRYWNDTTVTLKNDKQNTIKYNSSFSEVEMVLNDTDIRSIQCLAPVKDSRTDWRNVTGLLFVREPPKLRATIESRSGHLLRELPVNVGGTGIILEKSTFAGNDSTLEMNASDSYFTLHCNASFPVDFSYFGDGAPDLEYLPIRLLNGSLLNAGAYSYSAKLRFRKVDQNLVGRYSCMSATREFGYRNQQENLHANVNIFVPGDNLFTPSSRDNQTYKTWEYRDSVLIPCTVNDPRVNISLLKFDNETKKFEPLTTPLKIPYDPLYGFSLNKNHTPTLYGWYQCVGDRNRSSGIVQVFLPSDNVRVTPYLKEFQINPNETETFRCESKRDNVTITFSPNDGNRRVVHSYTPGVEYPYVATFETDKDDNALPLNTVTLMNCTTLSDNKTMHTWELYPRDGSYIDSLSYNNKTMQFLCCTKPYRHPTMEYVNCSSITECTLRQSACLTQNKCQGAVDFTVNMEPEVMMVNNQTNHCLTFDVRERPQGMLKCVVKGVHKIVAQALLYYYNEEKNFEVHDGFFYGPKAFDKFHDISHDKLMRIQIQGRPQPLINNNSSTTPLTITPGEKVTFNCYASRFFLGSELKWALQSKNGTTMYLKGSKDLGNHANVGSQLELEFGRSGEDWDRIMCMAPIWKDYFSWKNVSLPLNINLS